MKNKRELTMSTVPSLRTVLLYGGGGLAVMAVAAWLLITYFNIGSPLETRAATTNYSSLKTGLWLDATVWNTGTTPPTTALADNITVNSTHEVFLSTSLDVKNGASITINSNAKLTIDGDMTVQNNLILNVNGELIINGKMDVKNGANITVNGSGTMSVAGDVSLDNNATFYVDGVLNVGGDMSFGTGGNFSGNGVVNIAGAGCSDWAGPGGCSENVVLPVELLNFTLQQHPEGVLITWRTASEKNNDFFTVQHSTDGLSYEPIAIIAGQGTTTLTSSYQYIDATATSGRSYYRLTQTDYDGTTEIFRPAMIEVSGATNTVSFNVYPNPVRGDNFSVRFSEAVAGTLEILGQHGETILRENIDGQDTEVALTLPTDMPKGIYYVTVKTSGGVQTNKLIKQ